VKVVWTRLARNRLQNIFRFVARDSQARAERLYDDLIGGADRLAMHPLSGPMLPEDAAYRQLVVHEYRLVYRVAEKKIVVSTIVAPGMTYDQAL
jgi:addiction module RelE/StbE family toxin